MRNKIEEKISKFIKETEVSNLVVPELNVDSERDAWLRKMGRKEGRMSGMQAAGVFEGDEKVTCPNCSGSGKREGKTCWVCRGSGKLSRKTWEKHYGNPATMKEQGLPYGIQYKMVFNTTNAEKYAEDIKKGIKAPVVGADVSRLGGDKNVSILIVVSLQPKNKWANGILENSPYMRFHFYNNGRLEQFSGGVRGKKPMRKTFAKSPEDAVAKINKYIQSLGKVTDVYNPVEDLGNYMKKKKYGFSPGEGEGAISTTVSRPAAL